MAFCDAVHLLSQEVVKETSSGKGFLVNVRSAPVTIDENCPCSGSPIPLMTLSVSLLIDLEVDLLEQEAMSFYIGLELSSKWHLWISHEEGTIRWSSFTTFTMSPMYVSR